MAETLIRKAIPEDAEQLYDLRLTALKMNPEAFGSDYETMRDQQTVQSYARRIPSPEDDDCLIVAEIDGALVGMMGFFRNTRMKTKHSGSVWGVFLLPEYRGQGISKMMMSALMEHIKQCDDLLVAYVSVIVNNTAAIKLYEGAGFKHWGTQPAGMLVDGTLYDVMEMAYRLG